jgi:hypothetical protein
MIESNFLSHYMYSLNMAGTSPPINSVGLFICVANAYEVGILVIKNPANSRVYDIEKIPLLSIESIKNFVYLSTITLARS